MRLIITARELRAALDRIPEAQLDDPVMLGAGASAGWLHTITADPGARTVDLYAGTAAPDLDGLTEVLATRTGA